MLLEIEMEGFQTLMLPKNVVVNHISQRVAEKRGIIATSAAGTKYDIMYYTKAALAGGICCAITHGALW